MKFIQKVIKKGDDYFILIPEEMLDLIGLTLGDCIDVTVVDESIIIRPRGG